MPPVYYIDIKHHYYGKFVTIYDREVIEGDTFLKNKEYVEKSDDENYIRALIKDCVSIIFYGDNAVKLGVKLGYIHPEGVGVQKGVKVAIYIRTW